MLAYSHAPPSLLNTKIVSGSVRITGSRSDHDGAQITEYAVSGTPGSYTSNWTHTNVFGAGELLATYRDANVYFAINDWLRTKRAEIAAGTTCFTPWTSLPYGDGLTSGGSNPCPDGTEHHFTGKERDQESGNDYFDARYYSSAMGRFLSPDWAAKEEPVPYATFDDPQSLNLYSYVRNNPLSHADADGHCCDPDSIIIGTTTIGGAVLGGLFGGAVGAGSGTLVAPGVGTIGGGYEGAALGGTGGALVGAGIGKGIVGVLNAVFSSDKAPTPASTPASSDTPEPAATPASLPAPGFVGDAGGNVVQIPAGSTARPAENGNGVVYQPPVPAGAHPNSNAVRVMGPHAHQPTGSITVHNKHGQPINPATGKPDSRPNTHTPIKPNSGS